MIRLTLMSNLGILLFALAVVDIAFGQSSLELAWSEDGGQCIFRSDDGFHLVDVKSGSKQLLFSSTSANEIKPPDDVIFGKNPTTLLVRKGEKHFSYDRKSKVVTAIDKGNLARFPSRLSLPPRGSIDGGPETKLRIRNQTAEAIRIFWIDSRRRERSYGSIGPGEVFKQNTYVGHEWLLKSGTGKRLGSFRTRLNDRIVVDSTAIENVKRLDAAQPSDPSPKPLYRASRRASSGDGKWRCEVIDDNLWLKQLSRDNQEKIKLTRDGKADFTFLNVGSGTNLFDRPRGPDVRWSPDSKHVVAFQTRNPPKKEVFFVESSPKDRLQPALRSYQYPKPGDWLPQKTLRLFSAEDSREIQVSNELFENPWSLRFVKWVGNGSKFWLHYNQRGHQVVRLVEVDVESGNARTLIEESSETFIHYSNGGKSVFEQLPDGSIIWASERSGWNHLYRFASSSGRMLNPVTAGEWNVKRIEKVDLENGVIWFYAVGVVSGQNPYHEHFCRVNFDGSNFIVLTDGDGTHRVRFEKDGQYFVDTWSRVDQAPITELRHSKDGALIAELDRQKTLALFGDRKLTTRFSAKGRDGKTDIWGIIHWPKDFDPDRKYPVVENIYAGPHDHHVPMRFSTGYRTQHRIADEGIIVVQIDGMGTAWRSKAFHDVCFKNLRDGGFPDRIAWIKAAAKKYPQMDVSRVGIYGGSAGGQNAMAALLWHNDFYSVAVADCGCHDNRMDKVWWNEQWMGWPVDSSYEENSNTENAHRLKGKLMLIVGEMDRNVDPATTTQVVRKLIEHDKDFEFVLVAGAGHGAAETPWASKKRLNFLKAHLLD